MTSSINKRHRAAWLKRTVASLAGCLWPQLRLMFDRLQCFAS